MDGRDRGTDGEIFAAGKRHSKSLGEREKEARLVVKVCAALELPSCCAAAARVLTRLCDGDVGAPPELLKRAVGVPVDTRSRAGAKKAVRISCTEPKARQASPTRMAENKEKKEVAKSRGQLGAHVAHIHDGVRDAVTGGR